MAEAADVLGDPKTWTPEQKRQWNDVLQRNKAEIKDYENIFGDLIPPESFFSQQVKQADHKLAAELDVARTSVRRGDNFNRIAIRESRRLGYKITADEIRILNGYIDAADLKADTTLELPPNPAHSTQPKQPEPDATEEPAAQKSGSLLRDEPAERDVAEAAKPEKPEPTPEREYMAMAITQDVDPVEHIVLKSAPVLTKKEVEAMMDHDAYWQTEGRHPLGDPLQAKTREFFDRLYPEPQGGRAFTPREEPRPLAISHEAPLSYGRKVVAEDLGHKAANSNIPDAVRGLQSALNQRGYSNTQQVLPHLKEDGEFGPRTLARLDEELLRGGPNSVIRDLDHMSVA